MRDRGILSVGPGPPSCSKLPRERRKAEVRLTPVLCHQDRDDLARVFGSVGTFPTPTASALERALFVGASMQHHRDATPLPFLGCEYPKRCSSALLLVSSLFRLSYIRFDAPFCNRGTEPVQRRGDATPGGLGPTRGETAGIVERRNGWTNETAKGARARRPGDHRLEAGEAAGPKGARTGRKARVRPGWRRPLRARRRGVATVGQGILRSASRPFRSPFRAKDRTFAVLSADAD
jgi:hypothetical protein